MNKAELISADQLGQVTAVLRKLNGDAAIVPTSYCNVPLTTILNTRLFNADKAKEAAGWLKELRYAPALGRAARRTQLTGRPRHGAWGVSFFDSHDHDHEHKHSDHCDCGAKDHDPGSSMATYGISSFVFRSRRPFHPGRLNELVYHSDRCVAQPTADAARGGPGSRLTARPSASQHASLAGCAR